MPISLLALFYHYSMPLGCVIQRLFGSIITSSGEGGQRLRQDAGYIFSEQLLIRTRPHYQLNLVWLDSKVLALAQASTQLDCGLEARAHTMSTFTSLTSSSSFKMSNFHFPQDRGAYRYRSVAVYFEHWWKLFPKYTASLHLPLFCGSATSPPLGVDSQQPRIRKCGGSSLLDSP